MTSTKKTITKICPACKKKVDAPRCDYDPPDAVTMTIECSNCSPSPFKGVDVVYRNSKGRKIVVEPMFKIPKGQAKS